MTAAARRVLPLLVLLGTLSARADNVPSIDEWVQGYWEGAYVRSGSVLRVNMRFVRDEAGQLAVYREFPAWLFYGPLGPDPVEIDDRGRIVLPEARYGRAELTPDRGYAEMVGQSGGGKPAAYLHLKRAVAPPPPAVDRRSVRFESGGFELAGELAMPRGAGPFPGIVLVNGGRGCSPSYQRKRIAARLAEYGIAALSFDQRGSGDSGGDCARVDFDAVVSDVVAAYRWLGRRPAVDAERVGLWGSSAGSWWSQGAIDRILDASGLSDPAFMIGWVGMGTSIRAVQRAVKHARADDLGLSDAARADVLGVIDIARSRDLSAAAVHDRLSEIEARAERDGWLGRVFDVETFPDSPADVPSLWWQRFRFEPASVLARMADIPYLAVFGRDDRLVPWEDNGPRLRRLLREAGNENVRVVAVPETGHRRETPDRFRQLPGSVLYYKFDRVMPQFFGETVRFLRRLGLVD